MVNRRCSRIFSSTALVKSSVITDGRPGRHVHHGYFPVSPRKLSPTYGHCRRLSSWSDTFYLFVDKFILLNRSLLSKTEPLTVFHSRRADLTQSYLKHTGSRCACMLRCSRDIRFGRDLTFRITLVHNNIPFTVLNL